LPTLNLGCRQAFRRKLALYFTAPIGLLASVWGYSQHQSEAVVAGTMGGVTFVVMAATWIPIASYRTAFNIGGCAMMIVSQCFGAKIAMDKAKQQSSSCNTVSKDTC